MAIPSLNNRLKDFELTRAQVLKNVYADGLDIEEVKSFLSQLSLDRFSSNKLATPHQSPYIQPRGGTATFAEQFKISTALSESGADFIPLTIDSNTRHNDYEVAGLLLEKSEEDGRSHLNGYPLVNHGHLLTRELYKKINKPVSLRHGTPDARLLTEIAIASGITEIEGGALVYCLPYSKSFPVDLSILYWQHVNRICAEYSEVNRIIHRESFGPLTATMVPPVTIAVIEIIELLLAAEQGVKSFSVSFGQTGSFSQDLALAEVLKKKARHYLDLFGFQDVKVYLVYHQWMGAFPRDREQAGALISTSTIIANLIRADKVVVKTKDEAFGVPTVQSNCDAVKDVKYIFDKFPLSQHKLTNDAVTLEEQLISEQVDYLLENIFNLKGDAFWDSVHQAVLMGFLDIPFAPHKDNPNKLLTVRDRFNSIRIQEAGDVPMKKSNLDLERELLVQNKDTSVDSFVNKLFKDISIMM